MMVQFKFMALSTWWQSESTRGMCPFDVQSSTW